MVYKIGKNKKAEKTFWNHCPIKQREMVQLKSCERCPWFEGLNYVDLKETISPKEPWKPNIEMYEFATVICTFE